MKEISMNEAYVAVKAGKKVFISVEKKIRNPKINDTEETRLGILEAQKRLEKPIPKNVRFMEYVRFVVFWADSYVTFLLDEGYDGEC